jgi:thymidylate synthase
VIFPWEQGSVVDPPVYDHVEADSFRTIFTRLVREGKYVSPRGQLVLECQDFSFTLPPYVRFQNFDCRRLKLNYMKDEFLWYLKGDRFDTSIGDKAQIWKTIVNKDGSLNSNYGQYIFPSGGQFDRVVHFLREDTDSRRASMTILSKEHVLSETNDLPCTYALNFRIRNNELRMSVHMRSQDAIFGMGNDIPTFSFIHEMVLSALRAYYPSLSCGVYHHCVDSFHVYQRHFQVLRELTGYSLPGETQAYHDCSNYVSVPCPRISGPDEVSFMRSLDFLSIPDDFLFCRWLNERE